MNFFYFVCIFFFFQHEESNKLKKREKHNYEFIKLSNVFLNEFKENDVYYF